MIRENVLPKFLDDILVGTTEISKQELYLLKWDLKEAQSQNEYLKKSNENLKAELKELRAFKEKAENTALSKNDKRLQCCMETLAAIKRSLDNDKLAAIKRSLDDDKSYSVYKDTDFNIRREY